MNNINKQMKAAAKKSARKAAWRANRKAREAAGIPTQPPCRQFFASPARISKGRYAIVVADNGDGGRGVNDLRHVIGCWPYETAWMETPGGATVLAHEGEAIAAALIEKGWQRL